MLRYISIWIDKLKIDNISISKSEANDVPATTPFLFIHLKSTWARSLVGPFRPNPQLNYKPKITDEERFFQLRSP